VNSNHLILCDIGNTTYHFYDGEHEKRFGVLEFEPETIPHNVYYISVNTTCKDRLEFLDNWIDLSRVIDYRPYYETMGIDRVVTCNYIEHGVIIDVGSAITVDVKREGEFMGGFIYPGVKAMQEAYLSISTKLSFKLSFELDLGKMPKNSQDAISYGFLAPFIREVKAYNLPIYITGGDGKQFVKFFDNAIYDELLIFKAMKKILDEGNIC